MGKNISFSTAHNITYMNKTAFLFIGTLLCVLLNSCIHQDFPKCTSQWDVRVLVKDKNYSNVDAVHPQEKKDETLPFRDFIPTLYYSLRNLSTGEWIYPSAFVAVSGQSAYQALAFEGLPNGEYELTVWGNAGTEQPDGSLHKDGQEQTDLYVGRTVLTVSSAASFSSDLYLERSKGKLVLSCVNFPSDVTTLEKEVDGVYASVTPDLKYAGNTTVRKTEAFRPETEMWLAPTVENVTSGLRLRFLRDHTSGTSPDIALSPINLNLKRNEISFVSVEYNQDAVDVWTFINGEWTLIHHLFIE